jgi:preprotein translocase subunit SecA
VDLRVDAPPAEEDLTPRGPVEMHETRSDPALAHAGESEGEERSAQAISSKVPRNAPCPCGSGKKYKHCHGAAG